MFSKICTAFGNSLPFWLSGATGFGSVLSPVPITLIIMLANVVDKVMPAASPAFDNVVCVTVEFKRVYDVLVKMFVVILPRNQVCTSTSTNGVRTCNVPAR